MSVRFFHEQMALEQHLWLGAENVLGLQPDVDGVVAGYALDGANATLLLVVYPDGERAQDAHARLVGHGIEEFVAAQVADRVLGAVFGAVDAQNAERLIDRALAAQ